MIRSHLWESDQRPTPDGIPSYALSIAKYSGIDRPTESIQETIDIIPQPRDTSRTENHRISIWPVIYEGLLEITNPSELRNAILTGIGPARAYGNGLLSLAPAHHADRRSY